MNKLMCRLACLAAFCLAPSAQAAVLTFNSPELISFEDVPPNIIATYPEGGFRITGDATSDIPYLLQFDVGADGSQGLLVFADMPITLMAADGGLFSLLGLDYAAIDIGFGLLANASLVVSGLDNRGDSLRRALPLDDLGFTSFSFQGWRNLTQVSFLADADFVLDNINAVQQQQAIPEPASLALVSVALAGLALARRRKWASGQ